MELTIHRQYNATVPEKNKYCRILGPLAKVFPVPEVPVKVKNFGLFHYLTIDNSSIILVQKIKS